jgi:hypothetical protein
LLLTACGQEATTSAPPATSTTSVTTSQETTVPSSTSDSLPTTSDTPPPAADGKNGPEPFYCGEVTLDTGATHGLIADPAANGIVGCTEGFNVLDEFLKLPQEKRAEASLGNVALASGWSCTVDDGVTANISCGKDKVGDGYGFALHTEQQAG